jgi:hypothetical protein
VSRLLGRDAGLLMNNGLVAGLITLGVVALVVLLVLLSPRLRSVLLELPGLKIKVRGKPVEPPAPPRSGAAIKGSKLDRSPIRGVEGTRVDINDSELKESGITFHERGQGKNK